MTLPALLPGWRAAWAVVAVLALLLGVPEHAGAAAGGLAEAINKSGRQRMLTQRIVKLYCQAGMGLPDPGIRRRIEESLGLFGEQLEEIAPFAEDAGARGAIVALRTRWPEFRALALGNPGRADARHLFALGDELLADADRLAARLDAALARGWLVNVSGRQRMLSQRLALLYMLRAWRVDLPGLERQLEALQEEFAASLSRLMRAEDNTDEIRKELVALSVQWEWFRSALALDPQDAFALVVADASENMLRSLERIVSLYERVAERR